MKASIDNVYAIILAAGVSSRMGNIKQLLKWRNQSLLEHAIQNARLLLNERVIVVLGFAMTAWFFWQAWKTR